MGDRPVIADASVLVVLAKADLLDLLRTVFGTVLVPEAVRREAVDATPERMDARAIAVALDAGWIHVKAAPSGERERLHRAYGNLGGGEVEALALARDVHADIVLMDDALARRAARLEGLRPVGCLGVLARAHHVGHLDRDHVAAHVRRLLDAGLWVSADVVETFWEHLGGR